MKKSISLILCITLLLTAFVNVAVAVDTETEIIGEKTDEKTITGVSTAEQILIENYDGDYQYEYNDKGEVTGRYFVYKYQLDYDTHDILTVYFSDGTEWCGAPFQFEYEFGMDISYSSDQSYDNSWGVGTHTVNILFDGQPFEYDVTVVENPVERLEIPPIQIVEGTHQYMCYKYIDDEFVEFPKYYFDIELESDGYTVYLKDGTTQTGPIYAYGRFFGIDTVGDDQSYENRWGLGTHTARVSICGFEADLTVEIIESPVKSVTVEDVEKIELFDGYYDGSEGEEFTYFCYDIAPEKITINYNDGSEWSGELWQCPSDYSCFSDQSYENRWGIGTHTATLTVDGFEVQYNVIVKPSPVVSIQVDDIVMYENNGGYTEWEFNPETWKYDLEYYRYNPIYKYKVTFDDGSVVSKWSTDGIPYNNEWHYVYETTNQSYENRWGIGKHEMTAEFMGKTCTFNVEILPSPIKSISVDTVTLIYNADGYTQYEDDFSWFKYEYEYNFTATAELYDGRKIKSDSNIPKQYQDDGSGLGGFPISFLIDGEIFDIRIEDDQSCENIWGVSRHTATAYCGGKSCKFFADVVFSPIKELKVEKITLVEGINPYLPENIKYSVILDDGTVIDSTDAGDIELYGNYYHLNVYYDSSEWTGGNTYTVEAELCGEEYTFEVEMAENPYESLTISGTDDLVMTLKKRTGETVSMRLLDFDERMGGPDCIGGILKTDKETFGEAIFHFSCKYTEDEDFISDITKDVYITIGNLTSNVLEKCNWLRACEKSWKYTEIPCGYRTETGFKGYDKNAEQINTDDIVTLAVNLSYDIYDAESKYIDGKYYAVMDADTVKANVKTVFGISDIDLTKASGYSESHAGKIYVRYLNYGAYYFDKTTVYENGKWVFTYYPSETDYEFVKVTADDNFTIEEIKFSDTADAGDVIAVQLESMPVKTAYETGEQFSADGLKLRVRYGDNSEKVITDGFTVNGFTSETAGTKTVTVSYSGFDTSFEVEVVNARLLDGELLINSGDADIPEGAKFSADNTVPAPEGAKESVSEQYGEDAELVSYFEVQLKADDGTPITELDKEIVVRIKIPDGVEPGKAIKIIQQDKDGNNVEMLSWIEGEYICYRTSWLEQY